MVQRRKRRGGRAGVAVAQVKPSLEGYNRRYSSAPQLWLGYGNTIFYTVFGDHLQRGDDHADRLRAVAPRLHRGAAS